MKKIFPNKGIGLLMIYTLIFFISREMAKPAISIALSRNIGSSAVIGFILSLQNFLPLILSIPLSTFGDRFGQEKVLHLGSWLTIISGICFIFTGINTGNEIYITMLSIGQIFSGIAWTIGWISIQALVSDYDDCNTGINRVIFIMSLGLMIGPILSGYLIQFTGMFSVWIFNLLLCGLQLLISQVVLKACRKKPKIPCNKSVDENLKPQNDQIHQTGKIRLLWREFGGILYLSMLLLSFTMMYGSEIRSSYFSVMLSSLNVTPGTIGNIVSLGSIATCIIRFIMNMSYFSRIRSNILIYVSMSFSVAGLGLFTILPAKTACIGSSILLGLSAGIIEPVIITKILQNAKQYRKGLSLAGRVLVNRLGMFMAPLTAGAAVGICGIGLGFGLITILTILIIIGALTGLIIGEKRRYKDEFKKT